MPPRGVCSKLPFPLRENQSFAFQSGTVCARPGLSVLLINPFASFSLIKVAYDIVVSESCSRREFRVTGQFSRDSVYTIQSGNTALRAGILNYESIEAEADTKPTSPRR